MKRVNVPFPKMWMPIFGHLSYFAMGGDFHKTMQLMRKQCGDTYAVSLPIFKTEMVVTHDADLTKAVLLAGGPDAVRPVQWQALQFAEDSGLPLDLTSEVGDAWRSKRVVMNQTIAQLNHSMKYLPIVQAKADRLVKAIAAHLRPDGRLKDGIAIRRLFATYSLETMMAVLVGVNEPLLPTGEDESPRNITKEEAVLFSTIIEDFFDVSYAVDTDMLARYFSKYRSSYKQFMKSGIEADRLARKMMAPAINEFEASGATEQLFCGVPTLLPELLKQKTSDDPAKRISDDDLYSIVSVAIMAAVDTTSQSLEYAHAHMGKNADALADLQHEADTANAGHIGVGPVARSTVKESMRITPTVGSHIRKLTRPLHYTPPGGSEKDAIQLQEGESVLLYYKGHTTDSRYFSGKYPPEEFQPARFREAVEPSGQGEPNENGTRPYHAYAANVPFGHGARRCPGAGIAQLLVQVGLTTIAKHFDVRYDGQYPIEQVMSSLERPAKPISPHLIFTKRDVRLD